MGSPPPPPSPPHAFRIEELLAHADWLRRLALHVVRGADGAEADDVLQETWVAALRSPPRRDRPAEPWLAEVLRNFARRALRAGRARRLRHERAEGPAPAVEVTPERLLERAEAQRQVVELVLALDEPFRSTVLLRYFEGLSAAEIARAQDVPPGTVRWRLKEGLDRLRAALEARPASDRRAWALLLSPLTQLPARPALGWKGGLVLAIQKKTVVAITVLVAALLAGGLAWRSSRRKPAPVARAVDSGAPARPPVFYPRIAIPVGDVAHDDASTAGSVEGQVVSTLDGAGVAGAELSFSHGEASLSLAADAQGRFRFAPTAAGSYLLARVSAGGFLAFSPEWGDSPIAFTLRPGERIRGVRLSLRPARTCKGSVVDEAGKPVAGAHLASWTPGPTPLPLLGTDQTDAEGRFEVAALEGAMVEAHHAGRMAREYIGFSMYSACTLALRLGPRREGAALAIAGRVEDAEGRPVVGASLEAWANPLLQQQAQHAFARGVSGEGGRFELAPLDAIPYRVNAAIAGRQVASAAEVEAGARDLVLRVPAMGRLRGRVLDGDSGAPVVSFSVLVFRPGGPFGPTLWGAFTRYDPRGMFELEGVPAGPAQVAVAADGRTPSEEQAAQVAAAPAPAVELAFTLRPGSLIHGAVTDRATGQPLAGAKVAVEGRAGAAAVVPLTAEARTGEDGRFELRGVPVGLLSLVVVAPAHHGRILGGLELKAGQDLGPLAVDLAPTKEGEAPRIELVGIGASLAPRGETVVVGHVTAGGPAERAGLVAGDALLEIDGRPVTSFGSFGGAIQRLRGAEGTVVVLRVRRGSGEEIQLPITRGLVRGP
jgi:RNA polymerase sigma-70 factor (ECF subfamily)